MSTFKVNAKIEITVESEFEASSEREASEILRAEMEVPKRWGEYWVIKRETISTATSLVRGFQRSKH